MVYDYCVVGGGIVGLATAMKLLEIQPGARLAVLEKEAGLSTGRRCGKPVGCCGVGRKGSGEGINHVLGSPDALHEPRHQLAGTHHGVVAQHLPALHG
jgi:anaerobic glycerol-3-phosphate dehydrogenase